MKKEEIKLIIQKFWKDNKIPIITFVIGFILGVSVVVGISPTNLNKVDKKEAEITSLSNEITNDKKGLKKEKDLQKSFDSILKIEKTQKTEISKLREKNKKLTDEKINNVKFLTDDERNRFITKWAEENKPNSDVPR